MDHFSGYDSGIISNSSCIIFLDNAGTIIDAANLSAISSTGFDLTWTTFGGSKSISYLALGGADINNAFAGSFIYPAGTIHAETAPGFTPDAIMLLCGEYTAFDVKKEAYDISTGFAVSTNNSQCFTARSKSAGGAADSVSGYKSGRIAVIPDPPNNSTRFEASVSSFDAAGFTLNKDVGGILQAGCVYLALKGPSFNINTAASPTTTGTQSLTGFGFQPAAAIFHHAYNDNADGVFTEPAGRGFGSTDGASEFACGDLHRLNSLNFGSRYVSGKLITIPDGGGVVIEEAALSSFDVDGFTINWTAVDTSARNFGWLAIGPASAGGGTPVSSSLQSQLESQQAARSQIAAMLENMSHVGLPSSAGFECARALLSAHLCGLESVSTTAAAASSWYGTLAALAASSVVRWESTGPVLISPPSAIEAAQTALMTMPSGAESQSMVAPSSSPAVETLFRLVATLASGYEARGIATAPVSTAVAVAIEALQAARRSQPAPTEGLASAVRLSASPIEALRALGRSGISPVEALAMLASMAGVPFEADGAIVAVNYHDLELLLSASESIEAILRGDINLH